MTTRPTIIGEFRAGDPVPEWMLSVEPEDDSGLMPDIHFEVDSLVLEYAGYWHVIPAGIGGRCVIHAEGKGGAARIFAPTKSIRVSIRVMEIGGLEHAS